MTTKLHDADPYRGFATRSELANSTHSTLSYLKGSLEHALRGIVLTAKTVQAVMVQAVNQGMTTEADAESATVAAAMLDTLVRNALAAVVTQLAKPVSSPPVRATEQPTQPATGNGLKDAVATINAMSKTVLTSKVQDAAKAGLCVYLMGMSISAMRKALMSVATTAANTAQPTPTTTPVTPPAPAIKPTLCNGIVKPLVGHDWTPPTAVSDQMEYNAALAAANGTTEPAPTTRRSVKSDTMGVLQGRMSKLTAAQLTKLAAEWDNIVALVS